MSDVHPRLRKRPPRCTLDCGFKTSESPALRGFVGERGRFATTSLYLVLKSNGLHRPENLPVKFGFSPKSTSTNIAKKLPLQRCFKPLLIALFNFSHKRPTFAFTSESGYTLAFRRRIAHNGSHGETGTFPSAGTAWLCAANRIALNAAFATPDSTVLLYTYISRFSVNPHYQQTRKIRQSCRHKFYPQLFLVAFSTSRTNALRLLSLAKVDTHARLSEKDRTQRRTRRNRGRFGWGRYHYPRTVPHGSETLRGQGVERQTLPLLGLGWGHSRRTQRAFGTAMRMMRVAVPRRRGPAGLRDPVVRPLMLRFSVSVRKVSAQSPVNAMRSSSHLNPSTTQPSSKNRTQRLTRRNVCALDVAILEVSCYTDGHRKTLKSFFDFFENCVRNGAARAFI